MEGVGGNLALEARPWSEAVSGWVGQSGVGGALRPALGLSTDGVEVTVT